MLVAIEPDFTFVLIDSISDLLSVKTDLIFTSQSIGIPLINIRSYGINYDANNLLGLSIEPLCKQMLMICKYKFRYKSYYGDIAHSYVDLNNCT